MNFNNNITNNLHDAIEFSNGERERLGDIQIFPNHIVLGLMRLNDCSALNILIKLGIDLNILKKKLEEIKNDMDQLYRMQSAKMNVVLILFLLE